MGLARFTNNKKLQNTSSGTNLQRTTIALLGALKLNDYNGNY